MIPQALAHGRTARRMVSRRPVLAQGVVQAALVTAVAFGAKLSPQQVAAVMGLAAALTSWLTAGDTAEPVAPASGGP